MYTKRDAQYFAVVVVVVSASSSSQRVVRVFFVFFIFFTSPSNTADRERSFLFARKNEEKSPFARISREGEKTSKKPPVTRAYLHLTLVSLEQKTSANVITLA